MGLRHEQVSITSAVHWGGSLLFFPVLGLAGPNPAAKHAVLVLCLALESLLIAILWPFSTNRAKPFRDLSRRPKPSGPMGGPPKLSGAVVRRETQIALRAKCWNMLELYFTPTSLSPPSTRCSPMGHMRLRETAPSSGQKGDRPQAPPAPHGQVRCHCPHQRPGG